MFAYMCVCVCVCRHDSQLLSAPEAAFVKPYHHITLSIGQGLGAKEANTLPGRIEAGTAQRYEVTEQVTLTGTISGFF